MTNQQKRTPMEIAKALLYKHFGAYFTNQAREDFEQAIAAEREAFDEALDSAARLAGRCTRFAGDNEKLRDENARLLEALKIIETDIGNPPETTAYALAVRSVAKEALTQNPETDRYLKIREAKDRVIEAAVRFIPPKGTIQIESRENVLKYAFESLEAAEKELME